MCLHCAIMKWLVLIHVLSAIIGIGPTFFEQVLLRRGQSVEELRNALKLASLLAWFPKVGGILAVVSGLLLFWIGQYGKFTQLWILGSLILFVVIEIIVIGYTVPHMKKLAAWLFHPANEKARALPEEQRHVLKRIGASIQSTTILGMILFVLMIMKPAIGG